jgi:3-hydroxybutyrate dehydrogenase
MAELKRRCALVTGSTSGIGAAIAEGLAAAGYDVVLNGFGDPAEIAALSAQWADRYGVSVSHDGADMARTAEIERMVAATDPDILVNNAGIQHVSPVETFPAETWDRIIAINLSAAFHTIRHALPGMRARGWGRIVNIASTHGLVASPGKSAYVAAKHGIVGLTKAVALEAANDGVTVNAIAPGFVRTPLIEKQLADLAARDGVGIDEVVDGFLGEKHPSRQFVEPPDLAQLAVFLCSDAAASMTGSTLPMDRGWTAQ